MSEAAVAVPHEPAAPDPAMRMVPTDQIRVVANPRKRFPPLGELHASIARHGILQPLRVHSDADGRLRLIAGECRLRAAKALGLSVVPAVVASGLSDEQILAEQLIENSQRRDVHPMEEADAYETLRTKHGKSLDEIALLVAKSRSHVLLRLKLCELIPDARAAFYADKLSIRVAYALARVPGAALQQQAWEQLGKLRHLPDSELERFLKERFTCALHNAPFDRRDPALVPSAGACGPCPKRTGNARDLFGDVQERDLCTDPACFETKTQAAWTKTAETALAKGHEVLDEAASAELFPHGSFLLPSAPYVDLDALHPMDPKRRTWRQLLAKAELPVTVAKDAFHKAHPLVDRDAAHEALKARGYTFGGMARASSSGANGSETDSAAREAERAQRERNAERRAVATAAIAAVVSAATERPADPVFWRLLLYGFVQGSWHDVIVDTVKRRGWSEKGHAPEGRLLEKAASLRPEELRGLVLELVVGRGAFWQHANEYGRTLVEACRVYGVDLKAVARDVRARRAEEAKAAGR